MTGPQLYQHRPTIVRAIQFTPHNRPEVEKWLAVNWPGGYQFSEDGSHLLIETPEGDRDCSAEDGYWLVEGVAHELYCVRPDVFARVYKEAEHSATGICTLAPDRPQADVGLCRVCIEAGLFDAQLSRGGE